MRPCRKKDRDRAENISSGHAGRLLPSLLVCNAVAAAYSRDPLSMERLILFLLTTGSVFASASPESVKS